MTITGLYIPGLDILNLESSGHPISGSDLSTLVNHRKVLGDGKLCSMNLTLNHLIGIATLGPS